MAERIHFQFDPNLGFQADAVDAVVDLFKGLPKYATGLHANTDPVRRQRESALFDSIRNVDIVTGERLRQNLRSIQLRNGLFADSSGALDTHFTVEMETGTGKTYVYLRTILRLHEEYGFTKFMIVVPSIAIRMGVEKSIQLLTDHFQPMFNLKLSKHCHVYNSGQLEAFISEYTNPRDLSIAVLNIQAFNSDKTKLRSGTESREPFWDELKYIRPIVIIDEPQRILGAKVKSKSFAAIEELDPLFMLGYSATHRHKYNPVYKLDSFDAFQNNLVKKISVRTVHSAIPKEYPYIRYLDFTKDLLARIEIFSRERGGPVQFKPFSVRAGASLYELSGELPQYRNWRIDEDPHRDKPLKVAKDKGAFEIARGDTNYEALGKDAARVLIRLTIERHWEKQFALLEAGHQIKALSLFFVDAVVKVRDPERADGRGEYLRMFDEEYQKVAESEKFKILFDKCATLFPRVGEVEQVREGYFARDKQKAFVEVEDWDGDDDKLKKKSREDVERGIELILEKKDELITFDAPLAFIFSHSALREGWDNPNVFTLCTLKAGGGDIAKKQEIGRGLRLPVDARGVRFSDPELAELTVIANDHYEHFASALQKDFNEQNGFHKDVVTEDLLQTVLVRAGVPEVKISAELVCALRDDLIVAKVVKLDKNKECRLVGSPEDNSRLLAEWPMDSHETLSEHAVKIKECFIAAMRDKGSRKIEVINRDQREQENGFQSYMSEAPFKDWFKVLADSLAPRAMYKWTLDKDVFIHETREAVAEYLLSRKHALNVSIEKGEAGFDASRRFVMSDKVQDIRNFSTDMTAALPDVRKDLFTIVNEIMHHTALPRLAIYKIVKNLPDGEWLADQDTLDGTVQIISKRLREAKSNGVVSFEAIDGYQLERDKIFEADAAGPEQFEQSKRIFFANTNVRRAMHKWYRTDSDGEHEFARALESDEHVRLFTKLRKGGLVIETPEGSYSPDWAIVYQSRDGSVNMYFVIETKMDKEAKDLTEVEKLKIRCGKLHFKAVSEIIRFDWVNSYQRFLRAVSLPSIQEAPAVASSTASSSATFGTDIDFANVADFSCYPYTGTDHAICAIACALIDKCGAMDSADHLDAVLFAMRPDLCRVFLTPAQVTSYSRMAKATPSGFFLTEDQPVNWQDCCHYLENNGVFMIDRSAKERPIARGVGTLNNSPLPAVDIDNIVKYALHALKRVKELRKTLTSASPSEQQALRIIEKWHTGVA